MSFNVGNFVKSTSKTPTQKITDDVISRATNGLPTSVQSIASSSANALLNCGTSLSGVAAITSNMTDSVVSGGADEYFAIAGLVKSRAAGSMSDVRRGSSEGIMNYLQNINPSTKINSRKGSDSLTILSVV